jgi:hypothetical protein
MTISALKPFIPSGKDFAAARSFFLGLGFVVNWEVPGLAELSWVPPSSSCKTFTIRPCRKT